MNGEATALDEPTGLVHVALREATTARGLSSSAWPEMYGIAWERG